MLKKEAIVMISRMIIINGEDRTKDIANVENVEDENKYFVTYKAGGPYPYCKEMVKILENPKRVELEDRAVFVKKEPVYKAEYILDFGEWVRVIRKDGMDSVSALKEDVQLIDSSVKAGDALHNLTYLKEITTFLPSKEEEDSFLMKEMKRISFIHPESVLSSYLNKEKIRHSKKEGTIIFPFQFNLSQKAATENAFTNSISVIEGPPGTGKTQTILNILANLVVQNKTVAVVSNNNEAVNNVRDKLKEEGYGFLAASLGKYKKQEKFFAAQPKARVADWDCEDTIEELYAKIAVVDKAIEGLLQRERRKYKLEQELRAWKLEKEHFEEYYEHQNLEAINNLSLVNENSEQILSFLADTSAAFGDKRGYRIIYRFEFVHRLKLLFKYGVFDYKKLKENETVALLELQKMYYDRKIVEIEDEKATLENELKEEKLEEYKEKYRKLSMQLFRKTIYKSHNDLQDNTFSIANYKGRYANFLKRYPIILSTTYSLRHSIPNNYLLDYVIIDEVSQVDLITGSLAFSCCKNVIIVGDEKQLPQIVDKKIKRKLSMEPTEPVFDYFEQNILSSVKALYGRKLRCVTLQEHYRCHPQIIEFCNRRYYSGQLIIYTEVDEEKEYRPLIIHKTTEGNHMRKVTRGEKTGRYNQREIDVIDEIIREKGDDLYEKGCRNIGVVTAYRKQADKVGETFCDEVESDTVHKYQGREKSVMILSTVLDGTKDGQASINFVDDPHMINVAVSRAKKQFFLVTDHKLFFENGKEINSLIRYMQYSTLDPVIVESNIISVFDLLYREYSNRLIPLKKKMDTTQRYQSEEAMKVLIEEILEVDGFECFDYTKQVLVRNLINDSKLLTKQEAQYVLNRASVDFVIFRKMDKSCVLVIEVDGFAFHENNPRQLQKDVMKDEILRKYGIAVLRLTTNGSGEREKIETELLKMDE